MPSEAVDNFFVQINNATAEVVYSLAVGDKPNVVYVGSDEVTVENVIEELKTNYGYKCIFNGVFDGRFIAILPEKLVLSLAGSVMGTKPETVDAAEKSAVLELLNSMMNTWGVVWTETIGREITPSEMEFVDPGEGKLVELEKKDEEAPAEPAEEGEAEEPSGPEPWFKTDFAFAIGSDEFVMSGHIPKQVANIIDAKMGGGKAIADDRKEVEESVEDVMEETIEEAPVAQAPAPAPEPPPVSEQPPTQPEMQQPSIQQPLTSPQQAPPPGYQQMTPEQINVQQAQFQQLQHGPITSPSDRSIDLIMDVPLLVSVELGRKQLTIKEILELSPGSLIELTQLAGEPVDLLINGKLFARGEVVVIDENFGIRVTHIISPQERLEKLRG